MAGEQTLTAGGGFDKFDRDIPIPERGRAADEFLLKTEMNLMACQAGSSFFPINMKIVEIPVPVAEVGQRRGPFIQYQCFLVALKAEGVQLRIKRIVEFLNKEISQ